VVDGFADVLDVAADDGEVTVYEYDVGLFSLDYGRKLGEREAGPFLLLDRVDDFYSGRVCAAEVRVDHLLGGEVDEGEPGMIGELLEDVHGDFAVTVHLIDVRADEEEFDFFSW
jgi:hypothetical protein